MKRLLIAYDGSPAADSAINDLHHAALPAVLEVCVMSVADVYLPTNPQMPEVPLPGSTSSLVRKAQEKARQAVEAHHALATRACARVHTLFPGWNCLPVSAGDSPAWAILRQAAEWKADLILLGAQSHSRLEQLFLGSVSHRVAAEAPCSVRIGRPRAASTPQRIMLAVDGSEDSRIALQAVAARAWRPGTQVHLVTVIDPRLESAVAWPGFFPEHFVQGNDHEGREWVNRMTEAASRMLFDAGLEVSNYVYDGNPKEVLLRVSEEWRAEAIFLGARGLHHGGRLSLGTVASAVATRARCSVELVRPPLSS